MDRTLTMSEESEPAPRAPWMDALDRYAERNRRTFERAVSAQQAAVDRWADALEGRDESADRPATPLREWAWLSDVWLETLQNALVHVDDAVSPDGVDLDRLQTIWLHAADDALTDVGRTSEFAATMTAAVEGMLRAQARWRDAQRALVATSGVASDREMAAVGKRLLAVERRQKRVADAVDRFVDTVEADLASADATRRAPADGDASRAASEPTEADDE